MLQKGKTKNKMSQRQRRNDKNNTIWYDRLCNILSILSALNSDNRYRGILILKVKKEQVFHKILFEQGSFLHEILNPFFFPPTYFYLGYPWVLIFNIDMWWCCGGVFSCLWLHFTYHDGEEKKWLVSPFRWSWHKNSQQVVFFSTRFSSAISSCTSPPYVSLSKNGYIFSGRFLRLQSTGLLVCKMLPLLCHNTTFS